MTDIEKEELRTIVRDAIVETMAELRPRLVCTRTVPVMQIVIRIGSWENMSGLGVGHVYSMLCEPSGPGGGRPK